MNRFGIAVGIVVGACGFCTEVLADNLGGSRFEPSEVEHRMRVVLGRGHARLLVERILFNPGDRADQALLGLDVPEGAVATSLKTLGTVNGKPHWFHGDLKEAEEAARIYQELTGYGGYYPKDPALLSWHEATKLLLQVFPCMPKQNKAVGYTLELPMTYAAGRYRLILPALGLPDKSAKFTVEAAHPGDRLFLDDKPLQPGLVLSVTGERVLAVEPYRPPSVVGELAVADTGLGKSFAHVHFALAKQLSEIPNGAHVVVGLDHSRSMESYRDAVAAMAADTLRLFRNAQVQILDYDRRPRPRFSRFVPQRVALEALKRERESEAKPDLGNGSEIDLALAEAERLLAAFPKAGTKRILFFTDALAPTRITPSDVVASVGKSGAIVHIIHVTSGSPEAFHRNDEHPWADAAKLTGGLLWNAADPGEGDEGTENPYLRLVRPTTLDHAAYSDSVAPDASESLEDLREGAGLERQGLYAGEVRWARLTGELWSRPFRLTVYPDPAAGKLWSALVFGTEQREQLSEPEMMVLARRGGAVSPVTSYLAIEPGVRPSTEGFDDAGDAFGMGGLGLSGIGEGGGGRGEGIGLGQREPFDPQAFLTRQLAEKWAACQRKSEPAKHAQHAQDEDEHVKDESPAEPTHATVSLETHYVEVADVRVKLDTEEPQKYECLREAAWILDLTGHRFEDQRQTWEIEL